EQITDLDRQKWSSAERNQRQDPLILETSGSSPTASEAEQVPVAAPGSGLRPTGFRLRCIQMRNGGGGRGGFGESEAPPPAQLPDIFVAGTLFVLRHHHELAPPWPRLRSFPQRIEHIVSEQVELNAQLAC